MKKNKGIIGLGLIVAIVLGIIVVGGGAYYLGTKKNAKVLENNISQENKSITTNNTVVPSDWKTYSSTEVGFEFKYPPSVVIDPDPSHSSSSTSLGFRGVVKNAYGVVEKPQSLDDAANIDIERHTINGNPGIVSSVNVDGRDSRVICDYIGGSCTANILLLNPINIKSLGSDMYFKILVINEGYLPHEYVNQILSTFKFINSLPTKTISTALPAKYLDSQNWPPIIKTSSSKYTCAPGSKIDDAPSVVEERVINNKKYCITSFIDAGAGNRFGTYSYMTTNGTGSKTASFSLKWSSCGAYDKPEADQCQTTVSTFLNNLDAMVDSLMQS